MSDRGVLAHRLFRMYASDINNESMSINLQKANASGINLGPPWRFPWRVVTQLATSTDQEKTKTTTPMMAIIIYLSSLKT